jgi:GDP-L-fucose synthase
VAGTPFELKGKRVYVAGHRGMVGSALARRLAPEDVRLVTADRSEVDLRNQAAVFDWFAKMRPQVVFLAAAKVGGIVANDQLRAEFIYDNIAIATNVIHAAHLNGAEKLMFLGSSCIYPKFAPQPLREDSVLTGPLEPTNEPYAIAKIAGIKMAEAYRRQYGSDFISVMPTNLYGPGDNYHPEYSHVVAALIRRFHEAKVSGANSVIVWGTGTPAARIPLCRRYGGCLCPPDEDLFERGADKYRHRGGHHHRRIRPRRRWRRRLSGRDHLRHVSPRRYATQAARRQPSRKSRLACTVVTRRRSPEGLRGIFGEPAR